MGFQIGSYNGTCQTVALLPCPLLGTDAGVAPTCYARNVQFGSTLIFQLCMPSPPAPRVLPR